jgi:DNA-binding transcriptional MerR regulator
MTVAPNAQRVIDKYIQNRSAFIKSSTALILQLKRSQGNPTAVNAVGAQNLAIMLMNVFQRFFANEPSNVQGDCRRLKRILLERLAQMEQQLKENKNQNQSTEKDDDIVTAIQRIKELIERLNCEIVDPNGREDDETPTS